MDSLIRGLLDVVRAIPYMMARPKLLRLVLAPFLLAIMIAVILLWGMSSTIDPMVHSVISHLPNFVASAAGSTLRVLLWAALIALGYVAFLAFTSVLTTPFCERISEAVEEEISGTPAPPFSMATIMSDLGLGIVHSIRRLTVLVASLVALFLLSALIPIVGAMLALSLGAWFSSRFAAYDCFDTIWARKGTSYAEKMTYLRTKRMRTTGIGLAVAGAAIIPVLNALAFPLGTVAATRVYLAPE